MEQFRLHRCASPPGALKPFCTLELPGEFKKNGLVPGSVSKPWGGAGIQLVEVAAVVLCLLVFKLPG